MPSLSHSLPLHLHLSCRLDCIYILALKEQTSSMVGWAKSLNDEYLNEQQYRMNQVIYLLTMVGRERNGHGGKGGSG